MNPKKKKNHKHTRLTRLIKAGEHVMIDRPSQRHSFAGCLVKPQSCYWFLLFLLSRYACFALLPRWMSRKASEGHHLATKQGCEDSHAFLTIARRWGSMTNPHALTPPSRALCPPGNRAGRPFGLADPNARRFETSKTKSKALNLATAPGHLTFECPRERVSPRVASTAVPSYTPFQCNLANSGGYGACDPVRALD